MKMDQLVDFQIGQQYANRKGPYEVLEVEGDVMRIRWMTGEEITTTVTLQSRIIDHLERELARANREQAAAEAPAPGKRSGRK